MDDNSIDCVITSPPYWQLRDYGFPEQWGLEPTFSEYLEHLWSLFDEIYRVLKDNGTMFINLGDTYGTQSGNMRNPVKSKKTDHVKNGIHIVQPKTIHKCLLLIPHRFALGMIDRGWILRNDIIWGKRNCLPESVSDRFSKKHEHIFFFVKQSRYYFDLDSIKDAHKYDGRRDTRMKDSLKYSDTTQMFAKRGHERWKEGGKNPGDVSDFWDITTKPNNSKHYAAYNAELIDKPIIAGCPQGGTILDPFCGTGTTVIRAMQLNRKGIGIDGNLEYCGIARHNLENEKSQLKLFEVAS